MQSKFRHVHNQTQAPHTHDQPTSGGIINLPAWSYDLLVNWLVMRGRDREFREIVVELAGLKTGEAVLDVGCGTGTLAIVAKEHVRQVGRVAGIDPSVQLLNGARRKAAQRNLSIDFQIAGIEELPFPDQSFEAVLSTFMMHHLPTDLKRRGLAEVVRVLKPGGRLLIVDFECPEDGTGAMEGLQDLSQYLKDAGFTETKAGALPFKVRSVAGKQAGHQHAGYVLAKR